MATNVVNLDALIPREDFEVLDEAAPQGNTIERVQIRDLERNAFFYAALKKPDFQRETASWSPNKIYDFVRTFLDGDLIPALILWKKGENIFVIDGAHRLSALIAWVHDDYGDNTISRQYFQNAMPKEQLVAAEKTRKLFTKKLGTYDEHKKSVEFPDQSRLEVLNRARRLGALSVQVQWVTGDAKKAEASFFKINQAATPIDKTELRILKSRVSPNALASRVIVRNATGHKYWSKFSIANQKKAEEIGKEIYNNLFSPPLDTPIKTLDIPVAGRGYSAQTLPLIFDLVNLANDIKLLDSTKITIDDSKSSESKPASNNDSSLSEDKTGEKTIKFLESTRQIVNRISGLHPSSLGLHPVVYFYSSTGRYQPTAFLAVVSLLKELELKKQFRAFTDVRHSFENFLLTHKSFANQITVKFGSGAKGFERLKLLYSNILQSFWDNKNSEETLAALLKSTDFSFLKPTEFDSAEEIGKDFNTGVKSGIFLKQALEKPNTCKICNCLIHANSITFDHIIRKQDGGIGVIDNGQLAHPYCNTSYKN